MCVTHHTYKYASTSLSSQEIAFALQIHWLTFCITFGSQRVVTREKCLIRVLKPEYLGFCFKCYTEVLPLPEHHLQKPVLGWTLTVTDFKGETAKSYSVCNNWVPLTSKIQMQRVLAGKRHSSSTGGSCSTASTHIIDREIYIISLELHYNQCKDISKRDCVISWQMKHSG